MDIKSFIDIKELQAIQDQFSDATGLAAIAVGAGGNYLTSGSNFTDFCMKYTRGCPEGLRRCVQCDNECKGTYFCHAGLMDFSSDIVINGERVGSIIGGQVLPEPPDEAKFRAIARELGINEDAYLTALKKVPVRTEKMIRAAAAMLGNVVNQLVNLRYYKYINQHKVEVIDTETRNSAQAVAEIQSRMRDLRQNASMERIMAINASIEAGRAGQAGVGFGVVAREIGELANGSAEVYEEIQEQVELLVKSMDKMSSLEL